MKRNSLALLSRGDSNPQEDNGKAQRGKGQRGKASLRQLWQVVDLKARPPVSGDALFHRVFAPSGVGRKSRLGDRVCASWILDSGLL